MIWHHALNTKPQAGWRGSARVPETKILPRSFQETTTRTLRPMMLPNDESSPCCQDEAIKTRFAKATPRKTPYKVDKKVSNALPRSCVIVFKGEQAWAKINTSNWTYLDKLFI